jgi:glycosyltransferase involved in cell wall biosynthesis
VLTQEKVDVRVLIMDDASTDCTPEVGRQLAAGDERVEYRRHDVNRGHIATYNEALASVTADYCVILSADDLMTPGALARATRVMTAHPDVGLAYGRDITFRHAPPLGAARSSAFCTYRIIQYPEFLARACRLGHTAIQAPAAIARTALHRTIGGYREELPHSGDTEIWLRMAAHAPVAELDADQAFRRLHDANMSLAYSPLRRLEQQHKAFDAHFRDFGPRRRDAPELRRIVRRTIAESAFWTGSHAFDRGERDMCNACLAFAASIAPDIRRWAAWRRFLWKRRLGLSVWRLCEPAVARLRRWRTGQVNGRAQNVAEPALRRTV